MANIELTLALNQLTCSDCEASSSTLRETFDMCFKLHNLVEETDLPSNSDKYQEAVNHNVRYLENCTKLVNELDLFSSNETIEEISSMDVRYLLLPALLGNLSMKIQHKELIKRLEQIQISEMYFKDFLKRCKNYGVCEKLLVEIEEDDAESESKTFYEKPQVTSSNITSMENAREKKIQKFKALKELREKERELEKYLEKTKDEDTIREYYLTLTERWILTALDELVNIKNERAILQHMSQAKGVVSKRDEKESEISKSKPLAPMIITRNDIQKKVFGAGYPSLPVVSIEDFYKQRFEKIVNEHQQNSQQKTLQDMASGSLDMMSRKEMEDIETEEKLDKDDPIALKKARGWDDWKDDNPRGSGNRKNKG